MRTNVTFCPSFKLLKPSDCRVVALAPIPKARSVVSQGGALRQEILWTNLDGFEMDEKLFVTASGCDHSVAFFVIVPLHVPGLPGRHDPLGSADRFGMLS
jgi:hypothetical protein